MQTSGKGSHLREPCRPEVPLGVVDVDLLVRAVQVSCENDWLLLTQAGQVVCKSHVPGAHPVVQSLQALARIWDVYIHNCARQFSCVVYSEDGDKLSAGK